VTHRPANTIQVENFTRSAIGTADEGHRDDGEGQLEGDEGEFGDVPVALVAERVDQPVGPGQPELLERVGDDPGDVLGPEGHRVAVEDVEDADDAHRSSEGHHHHVEDGFRVRVMPP
jgi:hypothetical protein